MKINEPAWFAARIKPARRERNELGEPLFAHTSPIYITIGGRGVYDIETATEIAEEMDQSINEITKHGIFADDRERESVLRIYRTAIDELRRVAKNRAE